MSLILMTTLFDKAVILRGAIWRWSFSGLKGLNLDQERLFADLWIEKKPFNTIRTSVYEESKIRFFPEG